MKKQFIDPEILIHGLNHCIIATSENLDQGEGEGPGEGSAPSRYAPDAPSDASGWNELSGFDSGSGW